MRPLTQTKDQPYFGYSDLDSFTYWNKQIRMKKMINQKEKQSKANENKISVAYQVIISFIVWVLKLNRMWLKIDLSSSVASSFLLRLLMSETPLTKTKGKNSDIKTWKSLNQSQNTDSEPNTVSKGWEGLPSSDLS